MIRAFLDRQPRSSGKYLKLLPFFFQLVHPGLQIKFEQERPCQTYCFLLFLFNMVMFPNGLAMKMTPHLQVTETATDSLEHTPLNVRQLVFSKKSEKKKQRSKWQRHLIFVQIERNTLLFSRRTLWLAAHLSRKHRLIFVSRCFVDFRWIRWGRQSIVGKSSIHKWLQTWRWHT